MSQPLICDRTVDFLLYEVNDVLALTQLAHFAEHGRDTFDPFVDSARRIARDVLFPAYRAMDQEPPVLADGAVRVHPRMKALYPTLSELGMVAAMRPLAVGGQAMPLTVTAVASAYLMAANLSAYGYVGLSAGAGHLLEAFGSEELRARYMQPIYEGRWTGTMALTEPQAGSSLADVATRAVPAADGSYRLTGAKIFISGGDQDITENIVHMVLARLPDAPPGVRGISLFCVPKRRFEGGALVDNDVSISGLIHKIGWRGLPSVALSLGERGDCHGYLVGEPHRGLSYMFQMMNEARIMVGMNGVATASVAYHEALAYARERPQGRHVADKKGAGPQVPIVEHADVKRMLLRQKAIVEGGLALLVRTSLYADLAEHATDETARARHRLLVDLLTPVAKSFPAERGFEANALAVQVLGGYGYTSEYLPESWLRDQKLNTIHEGTTGIQGLDLLGRKVVAGGGAAMRALRAELERTVAQAEPYEALGGDAKALLAALADVEALTLQLAQEGMAGRAERMLLHSTDYLELFGILVVSWQHLAMAVAAHRLITLKGETTFCRGKLRAAEYFMRTELPRLHQLVALCRSGEDSYARLSSDEL